MRLIIFGLAVTPHFIINILVSLVPVFLFLSALVFLDTYKLIKFKSILIAIVMGCITALVSLLVNTLLLDGLGFEYEFFTRYGAPIVEEMFKVVYVVYLLQSRKIGFIVDAAIFGFAIGAGFGFMENIYKLQSLEDQNLVLWIIRGFGTAIMHCGTTAIFGIVTKSISDRTQSVGARELFPGFAIAVVFHSFYNHFFLSPLLPTAFLIIIFPIVFYLSEKATREWLGVGFDSDVSVLEMIITGDLAETNIGKYLKSLRSSFAGEIVVDMLCLLRLHLELSIRAKGILLMRENGFSTPPDPEVKLKFDELRYLEKSIGKTGYLAISPFLRRSSRDLWQFYMLEKQ